MKQRLKRPLAMLLTVVMLLGMLPTAAFAAGGQDGDIMPLNSDHDVSVQVQFTGSDNGNIAPGTAFALTMAMANNTDGNVEISIPLTTESEHLQITGLNNGSINVGQGENVIALTYDANAGTLTGTLPAGYNSTGTITMLFESGVTPTGETVTVGEPKITSGYDGSSTNLDAIGTTTVTSKTDNIDWSTATSGWSQNNGGFSTVGSGTEQYVQVMTTPKNEGSSGASYTSKITVTQKVTFVGFQIEGMNLQNVGDYIKWGTITGTFTEASASGYTATWVIERGANAGGDLTSDRVNTLDSYCYLTAGIATGGNQSIQVESNVTAEPVLAGYDETNTDNNKSTYTFASRAETGITVKAYGDEECSDEKLVFTAGDTIYYKVTANINGDSGAYVFQRSGFENLGTDQLDSSSVVSLKVNGEDQVLPSSTYGITVDLKGSTNTVELVYAFKLKAQPTGLTSGDRIDGTFYVQKSNSTLSRATQSIAYVITEETSSELDLRKTAYDGENGNTIVYTLTVSNNEDSPTTATVYDNPWPCEVFVLTDVDAPDGAIVEYEFADGSKTLIMPTEDKQPADKSSGLTRITVYNVPVEANGQTLVYLTARERDGISTPFTVSNGAGIGGGDDVTCNLILSATLTKMAYWDENCSDEITSTETVNANDTVYYKLTLSNNGENTQTAWFTLHDILPEGVTLVSATKDGAAVTGTEENGEVTFPAVSVPENETATWVLQCTVTQDALDAATAAGSANLTNTAYVSTSVGSTEYAQTPDAICEVTIAGMEQAAVSVTKSLEAVYRGMNVISEDTEANTITLNPYPYNLAKKQTALGPGNYAAYGIRVSNAAGNNPVPVYQVRDILPEGMEYVGLITPRDSSGRGFVVNSTYNIDLTVYAGRGSATKNQELEATLTTDSRVGATGEIVWNVAPYSSSSPSEETYYIQPGGSISFYVLVKVTSLPGDDTYDNTAGVKTATWASAASGTTEGDKEQDGKWLETTVETTAQTFKPSIQKSVIAKKANVSATEQTDALPVVGQSDWVKYRVTVSTEAGMPYLSDFKLVDTLPAGYSYVDRSAVFATSTDMINHETYLTAEVNGQTLTLTFPEGNTTGIRGLTQARTAYIEYWVKPTNGTQSSNYSTNTVTAVFDNPFTEAGDCTSSDLEEQSITATVTTYALGDMAVLPEKEMSLGDDTYTSSSGVATVKAGDTINFTLKVTPYLGTSYSLSNLSLTDTLPYLGDSRGSGVKVNVAEDATVQVKLGNSDVSSENYTVSIVSNDNLQQASSLTVNFKDEFVKTLENNQALTVVFPATVVGGTANVTGLNDFRLNYDATPSGGEAFDLSIVSGQVMFKIPGTSTDTEGGDASIWIDKDTTATTGSTVPELSDGAFTFTIAAQNGVPLPTNKTASYRASDGKVIFDPISYESTGTYIYTITENAPTGDGWTKSNATVTATVTVAQDATTKNLSIQSITYSGGTGNKNNTVTNTYTAPVVSHSLTYNGNPQAEGTVQNVPTDSNKYESGIEVTLSTQEPTHSDVNGTKVVFIGWTETATTEIYSKGDTAPTTVDKVTMGDADKNVYAAWGYDTNGNGTPDVEEDTYTLTYDANGGSGAPTDDNTYLSGNRVALSATKPTHAQQDGTDVLFVGWSLTDTDGKVYTKDEGEDLPDLVSAVTFANSDITVYAVWGLDTNGNDNPDVTEDGHKIIYNGNAQEGGSVSDVPTDSNSYLNGAEVTLSTQEPTHSDVNDTKVVFIGWTETATTEIYSKGDTAPTTVDKVTMGDADKNVYAAWGYDTNGNGTPDVVEETYTVTFMPGDHGDLAGVESGHNVVVGGVLSGTSLTEDQIPEVTADANYSFTGWLGSDGETYTDTEILALTITGDITFTAQYRYTGGGGGTTYYTLRYESNGGIEYDDERYRANIVVKLDKVPTREGYTFTGWYADEELTDRITEITMTSNKTVYAGWEATGIPDMLNGTDHFAYVIGYTDGTVRPLDNISRAEVATIIFRLLDPDVRNEYLTTSNTFEDVNEDMWCNIAISTLARLGIVNGRSAECFDPDAFISRAEFAAICARFDDSAIEINSDFTDISGHWAEDEIKRAATRGWIRGYTDNTFRPDNLITRAETMTMINRVLQRLPETEEDLLTGMNIWPDNQPGAWYYLAVQEATNSHDFDRKSDGVHECWTEMTDDPAWTQYQ